MGLRVAGRRLAGGPLENARGFLDRLPRDRPLRAAVAEFVADSAAPADELVVRLVDEHIEEAADATAGSFLDWLVANDELETERAAPGTAGGNDVPRAGGRARHISPGQGSAVARGLCRRSRSGNGSPHLRHHASSTCRGTSPALRGAVARRRGPVVLVGTKERTVGDNSWECQASPYLAAIGGRHGARSSTDDMTTVADRIAALRSQLPAAG